jgi:hypothetical protein
MKKIVCLLAITVFMFGCKKPDFSKVKGVEWSPNVAAPLGNAVFDVYDILTGQNKSDLLLINSLGELTLNYKGQVGSISANEIAQMNDQNLQFKLAPSEQGISAIPSFSSSITQTISEKINFSLNNGIEINELFLFSGSLKLDISTELKHDVNIKISFPDILKNGSQLSYDLTANYSGTSPHGASGNVDLSGAVLDLTAGGNAANNTLRVNITTSVKGTGNSISGTENTTINFGFNGMTIDKAYGYFGQHSIISQSDSILLKVFDNSTTGFVQLTNPKLKFKVSNSFGIPLQLNISGLKSINASTGVITNLNSSVLSNIMIPASTSLGNPSVMQLPEINTSNTTNMNALVNNTPKYFSFNVSATTNPLGVASNFVSRNSKVDVTAELELPLEGYANDISISDTLDFNFSEDIEKIESVMFRLYSENGFPLSFKSELFFLDAYNNTLVTLLTNDPDMIKAAPVDAAGRVTGNAVMTKDVLVSNSQIALLKSAKKVIIKGVVSTTQPQSTIVKLYDNYKLSLKLSIQTKLKLNL